MIICNNWLWQFAIHCLFYLLPIQFRRINYISYEYKQLLLLWFGLFWVWNKGIVQFEHLFVSFQGQVGILLKKICSFQFSTTLRILIFAQALYLGGLIVDGAIKLWDININIFGFRHCFQR